METDEKFAPDAESRTAFAATIGEGESAAASYDKAISQLDAATDRNDSDLFIISRPSSDGLSYTSYRQERRFALGYAFQLANPVLRPLFMDHDPNAESIYGGMRYWAAAGEELSLTGDSAALFYDGLDRLSNFLTSEAADGTDITVQVKKRDATVVTIPCRRSKNGLILTADGTTANVIYNETGVAWFYVLDNISNPARVTFPRTRWNFVGTRGSAGQFVAAGLPEHTHKVPVYKSSCSCGKAEGIRNSHSATTVYYVDTKDISDSAGIYGNSSTVQPPATEMGLWFAV